MAKHTEAIPKKSEDADHKHRLKQQGPQPFFNQFHIQCSVTGKINPENGKMPLDFKPVDKVKDDLENIHPGHNVKDLGTPLTTLSASNPKVRAIQYLQALLIGKIIEKNQLSPESQGLVSRRNV